MSAGMRTTNRISSLCESSDEIRSAKRRDIPAAIITDAYAIDKNVSSGFETKCRNLGFIQV